MIVILLFLIMVNLNINLTIASGLSLDDYIIVTFKNKALSLIAIRPTPSEDFCTHKTRINQSKMKALLCFPNSVLVVDNTTATDQHSGLGFSSCF